MILVIRRCGHCCTRYCKYRTLSTIPDRQKQIKIVQMSPPVLYKTLQSVLDVFNDPKFKDRDAVKSLMRIYNDVKQRQQIGEGEQEKHPLIVVEGLDGTGKSTITKKLSNKIGGVLFCTPPPCMHSIRDLFDDDELLRTAYYALGNYVTAIEISQMLKDTPVVLDRFWHSTVAYAVAQATHDNPTDNKLPPAGDSIYIWPNDLLKPDIILLLSVDEHVRLERQSRRKNVTAQEKLLIDDLNFRENVMTCYKNMCEPSVEIINGNPYPNKVVKAIIEKIKEVTHYDYEN